MSKASNLIYDYVMAEKKLEVAKEDVIQATSRKASLLQEIADNAPLRDALMTTGVMQSGKLCRIDDIGDEYEMVVCDEPVGSYSIQDEPEVMESGDE